MSVDLKYQARPVYLELGEGFADQVSPALFPKHILRFRNQVWAERVGLGELSESEWEKYFACFEPLPENLPKPLALRYHGHQFRSYNPDLGDGRGFLYAQLKDLKDGRVLDLGTKGSGQTPYSRSGDGRLTLKGAVREILATEMLESLGVYTSKTFSVFETGESLERHDEPSPTRAGVLVRLNHSHIRFGTFQRLAAFNEIEKIRKLIDYCARHYFAQAIGTSKSEDDQKTLPARFLSEVVKRSADLCASWMASGFVHGVLNTDNMNVTGESFDYGPYRFLPTYNPSFTAAYFDHTGLYAYGRQPESVLWNLEQLASCLVLVADSEPLIEILRQFPVEFNERLVQRIVDRLGLVSLGEEKDARLFIAVFNFLASSQYGFEQFFFDFYGGLASKNRALRSPEVEKQKGESYDILLDNLAQYIEKEDTRLRLQDDYFMRPQPVSLLINEIEWIWEAIDKRDDWSRLNNKISDIRMMGTLFGRRDV